jgi:hypothetical protein
VIDCLVADWARRARGCLRLLRLRMAAAMRLTFRRRTLRKIEQHLVDSDFELYWLFSDFTWRKQGEAMPGWERVRAAPLRAIFRLRRRRTLHRQMKARAS